MNLKKDFGCPNCGSYNYSGAKHRILLHQYKIKCVECKFEYEIGCHHKKSMFKLFINKEGYVCFNLQMEE